ASNHLDSARPLARWNTPGDRPRGAERAAEPRTPGTVHDVPMQHTDGHLLLSASDLVAFLECEHLSALDLRVAHGSETIERTRTDSTDLVARKGDEHEQAFLDSLIRQGLDVAVIPSVIDGLVSDAEAVEQTISAMRAGVDVIYQAALADGSWRGFADFLEKVPMPCPALGGYSYEVLDTKLARHAKAGYLVQLCLYSD